jgi:hypothetical protein
MGLTYVSVYVPGIQCDISAPKRRAEENASAMLPGHDRRYDRATFAGETIRSERVVSIEFQPLVYGYVNVALCQLFEPEKCYFWHYLI